MVLHKPQLEENLDFLQIYKNAYGMWEGLSSRVCLGLSLVAARGPSYL